MLLESAGLAVNVLRRHEEARVQSEERLAASQASETRLREELEREREARTAAQAEVARLRLLLLGNDGSAGRIGRRTRFRDPQMQEWEDLIADLTGRDPA